MATKGKYIIIVPQDTDDPLVAGVKADRLRVGAGETIEIARPMYHGGRNFSQDARSGALRPTIC